MSQTNLVSLEEGKKLMAKMASCSNPESKLQQSCVKAFRKAYPKYAGLLFAIPNGGKRTAITGRIMNAEGALAGVPDLFLAVPSGSYHGMFIEMKWGKNKPSPEQEAFLSAVMIAGYKTLVCYSFDEFFKEVADYLPK